MTKKPDGYSFGRPTEYKPEYCDMVIEHMSMGLSFESFAGLIGTCRSTLYNWMEKFPDFMDSKKRGDMACLLWWEREGFRALNQKFYQSSIWIMSMKSRFQWRDHATVEVEQSKPFVLSYTVDDK